MRESGAEIAMKLKGFAPSFPENWREKNKTIFVYFKQIFITEIVQHPCRRKLIFNLYYKTIEVCVNRIRKNKNRNL